jgi:hypothetical protein
VSYLFIAIVWTNHHHLMRYATNATPRLMWFSFAHLFSVSLLPLSTAWMAVSKLAPRPVAFYAAVFFLVNATYISLIRELIDRTPVEDVSPQARRIMRFRSITTLCLFGVAAVVALKYPLAGLGICICCLIVYLKREPPGSWEANIPGIKQTSADRAPMSCQTKTEGAGTRSSYLLCLCGVFRKRKPPFRHFNEKGFMLRGTSCLRQANAFSRVLA